MSDVRTAGEIADDMRNGAIQVLELWLSELRSGELVAEDWLIDGGIEALPLLRDDPGYVVSAHTGRLSLTVKARRPAGQKRYAEQLLDRA